MSILPAALGAGTGIIGGLMANQANRNLYNDQRNADQKAALLKNQNDYEQWLRQNKQDKLTWDQTNAYNHPALQMQRLRDAGLNPNLMYGNGTVGNTNNINGKSAPPTMAPQSNQPPHMANVLQGAGEAFGNHYDMELKQAQTDNVRSQENLNNQKAVTEAQNALLRGNQYNTGKSKLSFFNDTKQFNQNLVEENYKQALYKTDTDRANAWYNDDTAYYKNRQAYDNWQYTIQRTLTEEGKTKSQQLLNAYQQYKNSEQKKGIGHNADPFIRMLYADPTWRKHVLKAAALNKGAAAISQILKVVVGKGKLSIPKQNNKSQFNNIPPNHNFMNR